MGFQIDYKKEKIQDEVIYSIVLFEEGHRVNFFNNIIGRDLDKATKYLIRNWEKSRSILSDKKWEKVVISSHNREVLTITSDRTFNNIDELF